MSLLDILFNAAGGGVLGSALHCVTDYFDTKNKVTMLKAQMDAAANSSAWAAFQESQKDSGMQTLPDKAPVWVLSVYLLVQALKEAMRPILALIAISIIASVYVGADAAGRTAMMNEIIFGSFTVIFWWFGARYSRSTK